MLSELFIIISIDYFICKNFSNILVLQWKKTQLLSLSENVLSQKKKAKEVFNQFA